MEKRRWYSSLIAQYPSVVIIAVILLLFVCGLSGFLGRDIPSFENPGKGFETRGTEIKKRFQTVTNIENSTEKGILLNSLPESRNGTCIRKFTDSNLLDTRDKPHGVVTGSTSVKGGLQFCSEFSSLLKIVFEADFTLGDIQTICHFSNEVVHSQAGYNDVCLMDNGISHCCPDLSIGNVIASTFNKDSCLSLNDSDITAMKSRLLQCSRWYLNQTLTHNCSEILMYRDNYPSHPCLTVPPICVESNAVYKILYFLTDTGFVNALGKVCVSSEAQHCSLDAKGQFPSLRYSVLLLQAGDREDLSESDGEWFVELYNDQLKSRKQYMGVKIAGFDLRIEYLIFRQRLFSETLFPSLSLGLVFIIMWVYTGSLFITSMASLAIVSSIIITYFNYMIVFQIPSFGFLNLLALIIVIGVGADDVFVYMDAWRQTKAAMPLGSMVDWVSTTLQHAALSMFVTSFTTAVAFLANIVSAITAVKTFGIFAGTAIISNYLLMVSWLPAVVVIYEKYISSLCCNQSGNGKGILGRVSNAMRFARKAFNLFYEKYFSKFIITMRYLLLLMFIGLAVGMSVVVFYKPQLNLPTTERFQYFVDSDPLSTYILKLQDKFYFEKARSADARTMPLFFFWGVKPDDPGNPFDPDDKPLTLDYTWPRPFIITENIQEWFLNFCEAVKEKDFYRSTTTCFLTDFQRWQKDIQQTCVDYSDDIKMCSNISLPTDWKTLEHCLKLSLADVIQTDREVYGVKYDKYGNIRVITAKIESDRSFTRSVGVMESFWDEVEHFMVQQGSTAPDGLGRGWFSSWFTFTDLQLSLFQGTLITMAVSLACSFGVLFLTTLNLVISVYAIISIGGVLVSTVGTLVLLGWELGIMESVTVAIAVGLSVDFTVHLGVAYRLCKKPGRRDRTLFALNHMGPAITMAALTTFVAGTVMMPATILTYYQLGVFLMLIMMYSWVFANFFFLPICAIMGPQYRFAQISLPASLDCYGQSALGPHQQDVSNGDKKDGAAQSADGQETNIQNDLSSRHGDVDIDSSDGVVTVWVSSV